MRAADLMAYARHSPEVMLGDYYEHDVAHRAIGHGWYVLHTSEVGDGATVVEGPDGKVIMPDLQLLDLVRGRRSRFVEVKAKRGAYTYQKQRIDCTGIDWPKWEAYCRIDSSGVPVDLALIHLHWPLRYSPEIAPKLLWQTVATLKQRGPMRFDAPQFPRGAAVWDVGAFDLLGDLPNPPPHIMEAMQSIRCNLRVWEKPPKLRRPRERPGTINDPRQHIFWPDEQ
jgi:hypothetical protein